MPDKAKSPFDQLLKKLTGSLLSGTAMQDPSSVKQPPALLLFALLFSSLVRLKSFYLKKLLFWATSCFLGIFRLLEYSLSLLWDLSSTCLTMLSFDSNLPISTDSTERKAMEHLSCLPLSTFLELELLSSSISSIWSECKKVSSVRSCRLPRWVCSDSGSSKACLEYCG